MSKGRATLPLDVVGTPTLGDALAVTLCDVTARMDGTSWTAMLDPGGLSTQMAVEKDLKQQNLSRLEMGREAFLQRVGEWVRGQCARRLAFLHKLGATPEVSSTMSPESARLVRDAFLREGATHEKRVVWWCTRCLTALDEGEVVWQEDPGGRLYHVRFGDMVVRMARPELLPATVAVVGPSNRGQVEIPLLERRVPVIEHPWSGALMPGHDAGHYALLQQLGLALEPVVILDPDGALNDRADIYEGLDRWEARQRIVMDLKEEGLLAGVEAAAQKLARCGRCDTVLESMLLKQWFRGDWCISRQVWWGHRIPVWRCPACCAEQGFAEDPARCPACGADKLQQDPDTLDRWYVLAHLVGDEVLAIRHPYERLMRRSDPIWLLPSSHNYSVDVEALCDHHGPDVMRLALLMMSVQGNDVGYDEHSIEIARDIRQRMQDNAHAIDGIRQRLEGVRLHHMLGDITDESLGRLLKAAMPGLAS
ncbi:MAG: class I tRNA ligase family protein [Candidatus Xenobia bacterium]